MYQPNARIQTGPAVPESNWRVATFGWNGPVLATQTVRPVLIPLAFERVLTALRVILLLGLACVLLKAGRGCPAIFRARQGRDLDARCDPGLLGFLRAGATPRSRHAQYPSRASCRACGCLPNAAAIPSVSLKLDGRRMTIEAEVHAIIRTAVPLGTFAGLGADRGVHR